MKELEGCPNCFLEGAEIERILCYKNAYLDSCYHKFIAKCPYCGFEMRRNGKKHRKDLVENWNRLYSKNLSKAS